MEQNKVGAAKIKRATIKQFVDIDPVIESEMMKLVIDSYLQGNQSRIFSNGTEVEVSIHQGNKEHVHLFIEESHKSTVEIYRGKGKITILKNIEREDVGYLLPFIKCLGISDTSPLQEYLQEI
ncbi:MAG: hypothetical protein FWH31_05630 [Streptococcaceae bacterium]|nr:hypothetical protein [Streptococcaceae bacterium]